MAGLASSLCPAWAYHQISGYVHQFNTSASSLCGLGLEAVLMSGRLYSSLLDDLEPPWLPSPAGTSEARLWPGDSGIPGAWPSAAALCVV